MSFPPDTPLFDADSVAFLWGEDYLPALVDALEAARTRIDVAMFILGIGTGDLGLMRVREIVDICIRRHNDGLACRFILNEFTGDGDLPLLNRVAAQYLLGVGVPVRMFRSDRRSSIHSKYALIDDDRVIMGSGNWTPGGLAGNLEASVQAQSEPLVRVLRRRFEGDWARGEPPKAMT